MEDMDEWEQIQHEIEAAATNPAAATQPTTKLSVEERIGLANQQRQQLLQPPK